MQFTTLGSGTSAVSPAAQAEAFNAFIDRVPCLRENRGRILPRLACREPFTNRIDLSVRQSLPTFQGQSISLALDIINFGNLLNENWGNVPLTAGTPVSLLSSSTSIPGGQNLSTGGQPLYTFNPSQPLYNADRLASNYQMQLSVRYSF